MRIDGLRRSVWTKHDARRDATVRWYEALAFATLDCSNETLLAGQDVTYFRNREPESRDHTSAGWERIIPEFSGKAIYDYICALPEPEPETAQSAPGSKPAYK